MGVLGMLLTLYSYIVIARVIMSWVNPNPYNPLVQFVYKVTEPILAPIRSVLPPMGGMDLSPLVVFVAIWFLRTII